MLMTSRLINHSCDPSASAKIISINGQSKVRRTYHRVMFRC